MKNILVIGSMNMDLVTHVNKTPLVGETILGFGFNEIPGGKGANQAVAIGKLGGNVRMLGMIGNDNYGQVLNDNLKKNNVNIDLVHTTEEKSTGLAMIMVNEDGDNSIVVISGANFELKPEMINDDYLENIDFVLAQLETPMDTIEEIFVKAKAKGITTILNPAPARELSQRLIDHTDMLIPNETEFKELTGFDADQEENIYKGAQILFDSGVKEIIITLGKMGAYYINSDLKEYRSLAFKVNAVDTTAAGDSFIGGLLTQLAMNKPIEEAIDYGMKVGAVTVSRHGAQNSLPTHTEVEIFKGDKYL